MVTLVPIAPDLALQHDPVWRREHFEFLDGSLARDPQVVDSYLAYADVLEQDRPLARLFQRHCKWIFPPNRQDCRVRNGQAAQQLVFDGPLDTVRHETLN